MKNNKVLIALFVFKICLITAQYYDDQLAFDDLDNDSMQRSDIAAENKEIVVIFNGNKKEDDALPIQEFVFNNKDVRLITSNCSALILNGAELYAMTELTKGVVDLKKIATLSDVDETILDMHYKKSDKYTLVLVALQSHYQVYVLYTDHNNGDIQAIEKIAMNGMHQQILIFSQNDSWYCLIGNSLNNELGISSSLRIFKWRQSHFTLLDHYTVTLIHDVRICETSDAKMLIMVVGSDSADEVNASLEPLTLVEVYVFDRDRLTHVQNLHTKWTTLYTFYLDTKCYLISMPDQRNGLSRPESFVWDYNFHLVADQQSVVLFDFMVTNNYDLIVTQYQDTLTAFTMQSFRRGHTAERKIGSDLKIAMIELGNQLYVALIRTNENDTNIAYNIQLLPVNTEVVGSRSAEVVASTSNDSSEQCFKELNKSIVDRNAIIGELKSTLNNRLRKDQNSNIAGLVADNAFARTVAFEHVHINVTNSISMSKLRQQIDEIKARISRLYDDLQSNRLKRNASHKSTSRLEMLAVKRLWIENSTFENALVKRAQIRIDTPISMKILQADKLSLMDGAAFRKKRQSSKISNIQRLAVNSVNGISWEPFIKSLYIRNSQTVIAGNLILNKPCLVQRATMDTLNSIPVSSFFTLNTSQTIHAQVLFSRVHVPHLQTGQTNGLRFDTDIVSSTGDRVIESPVILVKCTIGDLTLSDSESDNSFGRHIVGTRLEDLSQIYSGKVTINGTLRLANVLFDRPKKVQIFVNEQKFALNVASQYWMKNIDQNVPIIVRFVQPVTTSQIFTDTINLNPVSNHLLITQNTLSAVNFVLREATIDGHLFTDAQYKTTLASINEQCIRRTDTDVRITGRKIFTGNMTVDRFRSSLEDYHDLSVIDREELLSALQLKCVKHFNHLTVLGSVRVTSDTMELSSLNGIDLLGAFNNMARIHEPTTLDELIIEGSVSADNLTVVSLDDTEFDEIAKRIVNGARLNTLHIGGSDAISSFSNLMVNTINGINVEEYLANLVTTKGPAEILIGARKRFLAGISVHGLSVGHLSGVDMSHWFNNVLHTRRPQELTGQWQMATLSTTTLYAPAINDVRLDEIIDASQDVVELNSDVIAAAGTVLRLNGEAIAGSTLCDLDSVRDSLRSGVITKNWRRIDINGVATWPTTTDLSTPIAKLFAFGVTSDSDQVISGDVSFSHPIVKIMNLTGTSFINDIDVSAIVADALLNTNEFQVIRGEKQFVNGIAIKSLHTEHDIRVPMWNGCDILRLNGTVFRADRDQSISGTKQFLRTPLVFHLHVEGGLVNGIPIDDIVCANTSAILPAVALLNGMQVLTHLDIIQSLNFIPFDVLLSDRVRNSGRPQDVRGVLTFQNLIIRGNARLITINGIPIGDIVIRSSDVEQALSGRKRIHGTLQLNGPAVVTHLNGVDLVHAYSRSVRLDAPVQMRSLEVWNNVTLPEAGMHVLGHVNDADVASLMYWQPPTAVDLRPIHGEIRTSIERVEQELQSSLSSSISLVYLDYASDIRIKFLVNGAASAEDEAVFIDTKVSCGDQQLCWCPVQNEIIAANKYQVQVTRRPLYERRIRLPGRNGNFTVLTRFAQEPCDSPTTSDSGTAAGADVRVTVSWQSYNGQTLSFELLHGLTTNTSSIRDVELFEQDDTSIILINYANGTVQCWRRAIQAPGEGSVWLDIGFIEHTRSLDHVCVLSWQNYNLLLVLSGAQPAQVHGEGQMFYFDGSSFRPLVSGSIAGDYDQCAWVYLEHDGDLMLWLGKSGSDLVTVFKTVYRSGYLRKFEVLQRIVVADGLVHSIQPLPLIDGKYMVVLTENSFMVLYRFNHLAGWIRTTSGYFNNIEHVLPLRYGQREYLYVSMKSSAIALQLHNRD